MRTVQNSLEALSLIAIGVVVAIAAGDLAVLIARIVG
jgi:hypothetical protein